MRRGLASAVFAAVAALLFLASGTAILAARPAGQRQDDAEELARSIRVLELRTSIERAHLDELDAYLIDDLFGIDPPVPLLTVRKHRQAVRHQAIRELNEIAAGTDPAARDANGLLNVLATDGVGRQRVVQPDVLTVASDFDVYLRPTGAGRQPAGLRSDLADLVRVSSVGAWTVQEAVACLVTAPGSTVEARTVDLAGLRDLLHGIELTGYLGPDPHHPLVDSTYHLQARTPRRLSADLWTVDGLVAASKLPTFDAWIAAHARDADATPPEPLAILADEAAAVDQTVRQQVDGVLASQRSHAESVVQDADRAHDAWRLAAGLTGALGLLTAAASVILLVLHARSHERLATTDPLTGAGNRRFLDDEVAGRLADPDLRWHLFAAIDLDRFKLINDTCGHPFGDAILVRLAQELRGALAELRRANPGLVGALVRLGGDEFLLALHAPRPADPATVELHLDRARAVILHTNDGQPVVLRFSYGIATATQRTTVDDLLAAADLAAYEEKAARAARAAELEASTGPDGSGGHGVPAAHRASAATTRSGDHAGSAPARSGDASPA